jgi:hypothetical protein
VEGRGAGGNGHAVLDSEERGDLALELLGDVGMPILTGP